jgi:hypothetical protein
MTGTEQYQEGVKEFRAGNYDKALELIIMQNLSEDIVPNQYYKTFYRVAMHVFIFSRY